MGKLAIRATASRAKAVQRGERAAWSDFEDRPKALGRAPAERRPVEIPINSQDQPREGVLAIRAATLRTKAVQRGECAIWSNFEDLPLALRPADVRCTVKVPIGGLDQPRFPTTGCRNLS